MYIFSAMQFTARCRRSGNMELEDRKGGGS